MLIDNMLFQFICIILDLSRKVLLCLKKFKTKSPSAKAKGLEYQGSPYWIRLELLKEILQ